MSYEHAKKSDSKALIVDDEEVIGNMIYSMLETLGYKGEVFTSSTEALYAFIASSSRARTLKRKRMQIKPLCSLHPLLNFLIRTPLGKTFSLYWR